MIDETWELPSEAELIKFADKLEPKDHCCECKRKEVHLIHIQYPNCDCDSETQKKRKRI